MQTDEAPPEGVAVPAEELLPARRRSTYRPPADGPRVLPEFLLAGADVADEPADDAADEPADDAAEPAGDAAAPVSPLTLAAELAPDVSDDELARALADELAHRTSTLDAIERFEQALAVRAATGALPIPQPPAVERTVLEPEVPEQPVLEHPVPQPPAPRAEEPGLPVWQAAPRPSFDSLITQPVDTVDAAAFDGTPGNDRGADQTAARARPPGAVVAWSIILVVVLGGGATAGFWLLAH
ncbi:hypothetical protein OSC27_08945 [Microbacterium sp. STN6]|uniref:hypothetical protein n=1 Tax=Microbacterium sp. STN6 TaxID=2995588 RepID=UPI002260F279|nr:hypothetical protein [Microbacterium sp. STN6]MCX7522403.1 hypothetical protein [Microbacterium sp. STN6]